MGSPPPSRPLAGSGSTHGAVGMATYAGEHFGIARLGEGSMAWRAGRRTGGTALALLCVSGTAALLLARIFHLGVAATFVAILGGLPGLYLAWAAYRDSQAASGTEDVAVVADQLALVVREQWEAEAAIRHLNDPYPLPVSWVAADESLADSWDVLLTLASPRLPLRGGRASVKIGAAVARRARESSGTSAR